MVRKYFSFKKRGLSRFFHDFNTIYGMMIGKEAKLGIKP